MVAWRYGIAIDSVKSTRLGETKAAAFGIDNDHAACHAETGREKRFVEIDVNAEPE